MAHPVRIAFVNKGNPVPCRKFVIKAKHIDNHYETSPDGFYKVGDTILPGTSFDVIDSPTGHQFVVNVDTRVDYLLDITEAERTLIRHTGYTLTVVDQDNIPQPNYALTINNVSECTDGKGCVVKTHLDFTYASNILHVKDKAGNKADFSLNEDASLNQFLFRIKIHHDCWLVVEVIDAEGKHKEGHEVCVSLPNRSITSSTNTNGIVRIDSLEEGTEVKVADGADPSNIVKLTLQRGENKVVIKIPPSIPASVEPVMVRIGFFDIDGSPLQNIEITLDTPTGQYKKVTDDKGNIWLPESSFVHKKKVRFSFIYNGKRVTRKL